MNGNNNHCKDCIYFIRGYGHGNSLFTCSWFNHHPEIAVPMWVQTSNNRIFKPNSSGCATFVANSEV